MKIITHPDNAKFLRDAVGVAYTERHLPWLLQTEVVVSDWIPKDAPTGRYVLQSGDVVDRESVSVHCRFFDYGPEDIDFLLYSGLITEQRELVFYEINDTQPVFDGIFDITSKIEDDQDMMSPGGFRAALTTPGIDYGWSFPFVHYTTF